MCPALYSLSVDSQYFSSSQPLILVRVSVQKQSDNPGGVNTSNLSIANHGGLPLLIHSQTLDSFNQVLMDVDVKGREDDLPFGDCVVMTQVTVSPSCTLRHPVLTQAALPFRLPTLIPVLDKQGGHF